MARILYLVHRLPYPPDKGDKVRSYHILKHLVAEHEVLLGTFIDDPDDERHLPVLQGLCAQVHVQRLHPRSARLRSLQGLPQGKPLTLAYYRNEAMARWVQGVLAQGGIDAVLVFSSSMAQYVHGFAGRLVVDFVDVDSAKWTEYAQAHRWPLSWVYGREGRMLLAYEREVALRAHYSFFATDKEASIFRALAPDCAARVGAMSNGVDAEFFCPEPSRANPYEPGTIPLVFTGAMDYWPNIDAVSWFAREVLPTLLARWPQLKLHIVGRNPAPAVTALAGQAVRVSGTVPDVRPFLQHAAVVVAPLRLARGVQNKVLEAMAMARPVVAASACVEAISARPGEHILTATEPADYVQALERLLQDKALAGRIGTAARACVLAGHAWGAHMRTLDPYLRADNRMAA